LTHITCLRVSDTRDRRSVPACVRGVYIAAPLRPPGISAIARPRVAPRLDRSSSLCFPRSLPFPRYPDGIAHLIFLVFGELNNENRGPDRGPCRARPRQFGLPYIVVIQGEQFTRNERAARRDANSYSSRALGATGCRFFSIFGADEQAENSRDPGASDHTAGGRSRYAYARCSLNLSNGDYVSRCIGSIGLFAAPRFQDDPVGPERITIKSRSRSAAARRENGEQKGSLPGAARESSRALYSDKMILSIVNAPVRDGRCQSCERSDLCPVASIARVEADELSVGATKLFGGPGGERKKHGMPRGIL